MFYLLNKKKGISSFGAIKKFAKELGIKKVGHTGTLDPLASGLLLIASDSYTKLIPYIQNENKTYQVEIQFGSQTDTYDSEGNVINTSNIKIDTNHIKKINSWMLAQKTQKPPIYSAKKINGNKSYDLARKGIKIELKPQSINVLSSKVLSYNIERQTVLLELCVSKGTYIRSLVNDLGLYFGTYAYMTALNRNKIGNLSIDDLNGKDFINVPVSNVIDLETIEINIHQFKYIKNGTPIKINIQPGKYLIGYKTDIIGISEVANNHLKVLKLFGDKLNKLNNLEIDMTKQELKKNIKLAAFDIDGTILPHGNQEFSDTVVNMFDKLHENGIQTTIATAREFVTIGNLLKKPKALNYFIGANGSFVLDNCTKEIIYERTIKFEDFKILYDALINFDDCDSVLVMDQNYGFKSPNMSTDTWFLKPHDSKLIEMDFEKMDKNHLHIITIGANGDEKTTRCAELAKKIIDENNLNIDITAKWSKGIFITPRGVTKSGTLHWLCEYLGFQMDKNLIAFGDSSNDYEMLRDAAYGVAMTRANDWVKGVAKDVALDCEYEGVYNKLKDLELI
ncbi:YcsE-related riboflavin metabolism phosphatase [Mycoplasmopsis felifaucium]|uniref:YcsE-related riboflavin metabolism phosphatase n=1 Tax=Mycoplasmopsis felifaucium TaxID=35768 RepID=UPI000AA77AA1|nr:tRNA pseudouridine(55) synthase TruB [Mycoplasmopsis felifaucium]